MLNPLTHRKVLRKGVPGRAMIVERGALDRGGTSFNLPMTLQVHVEGRTPYEVEDQWMVKAKDTVALDGWIPVRVDPEMAQVEQALGAMGINLDLSNATVTSHPPQEFSFGPAADGDDTISKLERLAALHASGALTDAEFAEQKRRILDGG
jgi:Short C-terminal domain